MGQSVTANVSAGLNGDTASGASVSASVNSVAGASVVSGIAGGEAEGHSFIPAGSSSRPVTAFGHSKRASKSRRLSVLGAYPASGAGNLSPTKPAAAGVRQAGTTNPGESQNNGGQGDIEASTSYSDDFPDSTKGTALLSPPDPGTESPLEWAPGLDFEFPDMAQRQFLNPTLHVEVPKRRRKREAQNGNNGAPLNHTPSSFGLSLPQTSSEPDVLSQPGLQSPLEQPLGQFNQQ